MASGRRSVDGSMEPEQPVNSGDAIGGSGLQEEYGRVRVWWEPTDDRQRSGFAGAWWPAKVLNRQKNKLRVKYDNGEEDDVLCEFVSPLDTLPVPFGGEELELRAGEFCEVFNGSKTDPCAWLGRVIRFIKSTKTYVVGYPFHDTKSERIEARRIRRARIMEDGEWRLIKPKQEWEDGDVTSPTELELIHEDELWEHVDEAEAEEGPSGTKRPRPSDGAYADSDEPLSDGEGSSSGGDGDDGPDEEGGKKRREKKDKSLVKPTAHPVSKRRLEAGVRSGTGAAGSETPTPQGMLSLYVTIEPTPEGHFCFMPVPAGSALPPSAVKVFFPYSAVPQLRDAAKAQLLGQAQAHGGGPAGGARGLGPEAGPSQQLHGLDQTKRKEPYKRHKTAWNVFVGKQMKSISDSNPGRPHGELIQILGGIWREMNVEQRAEYEAESQKFKAERIKAQGGADALAAEHQEGPRSRAPALDTDPSKGGASPLGLAPRAPGSAAAAAGAAAPNGAAAAAPVPAPVLPRTAQQMYSTEFLKALSSAPGNMNHQAKLRAAAAAWLAVDAAVKAKYEERAATDVKRYDRDLAAWQKQQAAAVEAMKAEAAEAAKAEAAEAAKLEAAQAAAAAAPPPAAAAAAPGDGGAVASSSVDLDLEDVDEVLNKGLDLREVERRVSELGYSHAAYVLLVDAWRKESPRIGEVLQVFRSQVHGRDAPDWEAFLRGAIGAERLSGLKQPAASR